MPKSVTCSHRAPIFEWYLVRCCSKNGYIKDVCLKEIGLHAQNMIITILSSIVDIIGGGGGPL